MGNWNVSIRGIGAHHNKDNPGDVDRLVSEFVQKLLDSGQNVTGAELTYGGAQVFLSTEVGLHGSPKDGRVGGFVAPRES